MFLDKKYESIIKETLIDNDVLLSFLMKDPKRQNIYENIFREELIKEGFDVQKLKASGPEAHYLLNDQIVHNIKNKPKELKSLDFIIHHNNKVIYVVNKYTNEPGGAQDNQYNDVIINAIPLYIEQYGKYYNINISVQNFSNRSILFDPSKINIKGYKLKKKKKDAQGPTIDKTIDMEILSNVEYDKIVRRKQSWNNFMVAMTESANVSEVGHSYSTTTQTGSNIVTNNSQASAYIGNTYGYASANSSSYTTTYGQSTNHSYNGTEAYLAQQKANENIQEFENSQRQIRERINDGYVKMHTIPSKSEYAGFFNVKYKNIDHLQMTIVIDDETYEFMF